jgi:copper transport protein
LGAAVSLLVPWPTLPGADEPKPLDLSAEFFISQEPFQAGNAPLAVRLSGGSGATRLALGYPPRRSPCCSPSTGPGATDETLTDPNHLVTRRIVYPDHD